MSGFFVTGQSVTAARRLDLYHATQSRHMTTLETVFKTILLDCATTGVPRTTAGLDCLAAAAPMQESPMTAQAPVSDQGND